MWTLLSLALRFIITSPTVRAIAVNTINSLAQHGKELVPVAIDGIRIAAENKLISSTQKFSVASNFVAKTTDVPKSVVDLITQATYTAAVNPDVNGVSISPVVDNVAVDYVK